MTASPGAAARSRILTFLPYYTPGFEAGGPVRTITNMVAQLSDHLAFRIVTLDRDINDRRPYPSIRPGWNPVDGAEVLYRAPTPAGALTVAGALGRIDYDLVYLNTALDPGSGILPMLWRRLGGFRGRPVLVAPRGEFNAEALAIKAGKKRAYVGMARALGLFRGLYWHASSEAEKQAIIEAADVAPDRVFIAPNLTGRSAAVEPAPSPDPSGLRLVFLSRLSAKKNLLEAIDMVARSRVPLTLDVYGMSDDPAYVDRCVAAAGQVPSHIRIAFRGVVEPAAVEGVLAGYDLFFLPTRGENYGHAIREALSAGLPVLISDQTPWRGLEDQGAGADLPLDEPAAFTRWIEAFAGLSPERRAEMRKAARRIGDDPVASARNREANRLMFEAILASGRGDR